MSFYSGNRKNDKKQSDSSVALTAVAFQDHLMRTIGKLSLSDAVRPQGHVPPKPRPKKEVRAVVNTGRGKVKPQKKKTSEVEYQEFVLDAKPPPQTLAQKMGLVEGPSQLLTEEQWQKAKAKSNEREDSHQPCVICKEPFGLEQQVLLSCTHVFHRTCLEAFERFTGKKTCPMCRKEQYQTRVIHEGSKHHRVDCAIRIQAYWRGYVTRCWYKKLRETVPPKDPKLRKKFYEDKLQSITDRMVRSCDYDVNSFLREIDRSMEASRNVFRHFDHTLQILTEEDWDRIQLQAVERSNSDCPICLTALEDLGLVPTNKSRSSKSNVRSSGAVDQSPNELSQSSSSDLSETPRTLKGCRARVLLSCTHVFHKTCLEAFEEFAVGSRQFVCPVCRSNYQKKLPLPNPLKPCVMLRMKM